MIKKSALSIWLLLLQTCSYASEDISVILLRKISGINKPNIQVLLLKGADCINCYKAGQMAMQQKLINPDIIIVKDVPKRNLKDFLSDEIGIDVTGKVVMQNDSIWDAINTYGTSAIAYIAGSYVQRLIQTKNIFAELAEDKRKTDSTLYPLKDSIDITPYYGGSQSAVVPIDDGFLVYNNTKGKIIQLSGPTYKSSFVFEPSKDPFCSLDSIEKYILDVPKSTIEKNIKHIHKGDDAELNGKFRIVSTPYISKTKLFIPMSTYIMDTQTVEGKIHEMMYSYNIMGVYDRAWHRINFYLFPYKTQANRDVFENYVGNGEIVDDCHFYMMLTAFEKRDSLYAEYDLCGESKPILNRFINVKYPDYFPAKNKLNMPRCYPAKFISIGRVPYYYFWQQHILFAQDKNDKSVTLKGLPDNDIVNDTIQSSIFNMQSDEKNLYVLYSDHFKTVKVNTYQVNDFSLTSSVTVAEGKVKDAFFNKNMICTVQEDDDRVMIHRYHFK